VGFGGDDVRSVIRWVISSKFFGAMASVRRRGGFRRRGGHLAGVVRTTSGPISSSPRPFGACNDGDARLGIDRVLGPSVGGPRQDGPLIPID